jgi:hypothetical protein
MNAKRKMGDARDWTLQWFWGATGKSEQQMGWPAKALAALPEAKTLYLNHF